MKGVRMGTTAVSSNWVEISRNHFQLVVNKGKPQNLAQVEGLKMRGNDERSVGDVPAVGSHIF